MNQKLSVSCPSGLLRKCTKRGRVYSFYRMHNYLKRQPTHKEEIYRVTEDYVYADARHRWSDDDKLPARRRGTQTRSRQVSPGLTVGFMKREKKSRVTAESKNRLAGVELPGTSGTREKYFLFFMSYSESGGGE